MSSKPSRPPFSWKEWSGRVDGDDGYVFGDVARSIASGLFPQRRRRRINSSNASSNTESTAPEKQESDTQSSGSLERAVKGLQTLLTGLKMFDDLHMPHCAPALDKIRAGVEELEARMKEAVTYQQRLPEGGALLQVQVCSAAGDEDPPEWCMGQLYAGTDSLFFESTEFPPWSIGPVKWSDIVSLQRLHGHADRPGSNGDIRLHVSGGPTAHYLAGLGNLDILEKLGGLTNETDVAQGDNVAKIANDAGALPLNQGVPHRSQSQDHSNDMGPGAYQGGATPQSYTADSWLNQYETGLESQNADETVSPKASSIVLGRTVSAHSMSFVPAADSLPHEAPAKLAPVFQMHMPNATIEDIRKLMSVDVQWPLRIFLEEYLKITEVQETKWAPSQRVPGTLMRRMRFRMPVPADVPQSVKRLVSLPETSQVTFLARLGCSSDKVVLAHEVCTHDVTFGENFWAQDVLVFKSDAAGGVMFEKFTTIRWVVALPWYAAVLGTYIEMKAKEDSKSAASFLVKYLEREHGL